jgi:hypothetical protein
VDGRNDLSSFIELSRLFLYAAFLSCDRQEADCKEIREFVRIFFKYSISGSMVIETGFGHSFSGL